MLEKSKQGTNDLRGLVSRIRSIGHLFLDEEGPTDELKEVFLEIGKVYQIVIEAIEAFISPAFEGEIKAKTYISFERGSLADKIEKGKGHCSNIERQYWKNNGIREWLVKQIDEENMEMADSIFSDLSDADVQVFFQIERIGDILTNESTVVVNLLALRQHNKARARIMEVREQLLPIEENLQHGFKELRELMQELGYSEKVE